MLSFPPAFIGTSTQRAASRQCIQTDGSLLGGVGPNLSGARACPSSEPFVQPIYQPNRSASSPSCKPVISQVCACESAIEGTVDLRSRFRRLFEDVSCAFHFFISFPILTSCFPYLKSGLLANNIPPQTAGHRSSPFCSGLDQAISKSIDVPISISGVCCRDSSQSQCPK
jgi:hypothetical protein